MQPTPSDPGQADVPLIVDIDGTLIRSDLLVESGLRFLADRPFSAWRLPLWLKEGKARLKAELARVAPPDIAHVPLNEEVVAAMAAAKNAGRRVHLASAADRSLVERLAERVGADREIFASDGHTNLLGRRKAAALVERFGEGGFDYIGNEDADYPVWEKARRAVCACSSARFAEEVAQRFPGACHIATRAENKRDYVRLLRPELWLLNLLIALPLILAEQADAGVLGELVLAIIAFCLLGSATALVDAIAGLDGHRRNPGARFWSLAQGSVLLIRLVPLIAGLALAGLIAASIVSLPFLLTALVFLTLGIAAALGLKRLPLIGPITIAALVAIRPLAGAIVLETALPPLLLAVLAAAALVIAYATRRQDQSG